MPSARPHVLYVVIVVSLARAFYSGFLAAADRFHMLDYIHLSMPIVCCYYTSSAEIS